MVTIGNSAFEYCSSYTGTFSFPKATSAGQQAFYLCSKLTEVDFPVLKTLGASAFYSCDALATTSFPVLEQMGDKAFYSTKALKSFVIPASLASVPGGAFESSGLENIVIADGETPLSFTGYRPYSSGSENHLAFMSIRTLRTIYIGRNLNYEADKVYFDFYDTETSKWVNVRAGSPFSNLYSADITLGDKMTEAHEYLLHNSSVNTARFIIPASIMTVGYNAFAFHDTPAQIHYAQADPQNIDAGAFTSEIYNTTELHVPKGSKSKFMACTGWKNFLYIVDDLESAEEGGGGDTPGGEGVVMSGLDAYVFMRPDEERNVSALLKGATATGWESSDDNIVEVTRRGLAFAYEFGEAILTAKDADGNAIGRIGVFVCPTVTVVYPSGCNVTCRSVYNTPVELDLQPVKGWAINTVTHDGVDVTDRVDSKGHYSSDPITADTTLHLSLEEATPTGVESVLGTSPVKLFVNDLTLTITGAEASETVYVTGLAGKQLYSGTDKTIDFSEHGIYLVRVGDWTFKIVI